MRWTDLPPDREPADTRACVSRGEWEDLRRRLERLPPGHPSRPGEEDLADGDEVGKDLTEEDRADQGKAEAGSSGRRAVADSEAARRGEGPESRDPEAAKAAVRGRREPYRPWFTAGESPQPWFAADPSE